MENKLITVASIRRPHGLRGELVFSSDIHDNSFFLRVRKFTLKSGKGDVIPVEVGSVRGSGKHRIIGFDGLGTLEAVEGFRASELVVSRSLVPPLPDGEFYHFDIIGMRVCLENGGVLGDITEILETGANDVYLVTGEGGRECLIPATKEVVKRVDIKKREMVVLPLEGMLEDV